MCCTLEITPHHLTFTTDDYANLGTLIQMNPPVRSIRHQNALWMSVERGIVDVIGSDHAPHTLEEKKYIYPSSPSGMTGVQTMVPIMLDYVNARRLTLERFVDLTSHGPNRIFGINRKGRISVGYDADLTIIDMKRQGWPIGTIIRGYRVMWDGEVITPAIGEPIEFS